MLLLGLASNDDKWQAIFKTLSDWYQQWTCNSFVVKNSVTPQTRRYTSL